MKYVCFCYSETSDNPPIETTWEDGGPVGDELRASGRLIASETLEAGEVATVVRVRNGQLTVGEVPPDFSAAHLSSFFLIDARDLNDAIRIASQLPSARVGNIEIRPVRQEAQPPI